MEDFPFPIVGEHDPLASDPFFAWCNTSIERTNLEKSKLGIRSICRKPEPPLDLPSSELP